MRNFPDFQMELIQASDFILASELSQKAFQAPPFDNFGNIIREIIEDIDRLADNCHMPEFTDHALPHICSIVKKISDWGKVDGWIEELSAAEAGYLLLSTLIHDIGMLSQKPEDLGSSQVNAFPPGMADVATWVRKTHVDRLEGLITRLAHDHCMANIVSTGHFKIIIALAKAHQCWPWESGFTNIVSVANDIGVDPGRAKGLAAIIAVADLLDEGNNRCDTITLIQHRQGNLMNKAHWLRHSLTQNRVEIENSTVNVEFTKPNNSGNDLEQVFRALRNHYRLVLLYKSELNNVHAGIRRINFNPSTGVPMNNWHCEETWDQIKNIIPCPAEQLLMTFMPAARNESQNQNERTYYKEIGLELLDLRGYTKFIGQKELLTEDEMIFAQLFSAMEG